MSNALRLALIYLTFGVLWILITDWIVDPDPSTQFPATDIQTIKGLLFVAISTGLLWFVARLLTGNVDKERARYRELFEHNPQPMFVYDIETLDILAANNAAVLQYGHSREEFLSMTIADMRPHEDVPRLLENVSLVTEGVDRAGVWRHLRKDGSLLWVEITSHTLKFRGRRAEMVLAKDVTEQVAQEQENRALRDRLAHILDSVQEGIHGLDAQGRIVFENAAGATMFGWEREEMIGRQSHDLIHHHRIDGSEYPRSECPVYMTLHDGRARHVEDEVFFRKDGSSFPVSYGVTAQFDAAGNITGAVVSFRDLTATRSSEAALRDSQSMLKMAMRVSRLGAWTLERTGDGDRLRWSEGMFWIHDLPPQAEAPALEQGLDYYLPEEREKVVQAIEACFAKGRPIDAAEWMLVTAAGRRRLVRVHGETIRGPGGKVIRVQGTMQDITEEKEAHQRMLRSEKRFFELADAMPFMVWTAEPDGQVDYANRVLQDYAGQYKGENLGSGWLETVHPDDLDRTIAVWNESVRAREPYHTEFRLRRRDGVYRWHQLHAILIEDASSVSKWYGTATDVHEIKLAEEKAQKVSTRLLNTLESITDAFFILDRDWRFTYVNGQAEKFLQKPRLELIGKNVWKMFSSARGTLFETKYRRAFETGETVVFEEWYPAPLEKWFAVRAYPSDQGLAVYFRDITERRNERLALQESEERFRLLSKVTNDAIWDWDLNTDRLWWSDGFEKVFGFSREEIEQGIESWTNRIHPEDRDPVYLDVKGAIDSGKSHWEGEYRFLKADGSYADVIDRGHVIRDAAGKAVRMIGGVTDLSERRALEEQFRQSQKMEAIGQLAGGVAHDFNNMLTVILSRAERALDHLDSTDPLRTGVQEIHEAATRSAALTRQLLTYARKQEVQPRVLDLNETVEVSLRMLRRLVGEDIDLVWSPEKELWPVRIDPSQMDQILANLCVNARDAIPGTGRVRIESRNATLDTVYCRRYPGCQPGDYVMLAFSDDGTGMDKATLSRIFEPFFTTKQSGKGTGLGLSTVYGIVRQNNGYIHVYSEKSKGTTFRIYFPRQIRVEEVKETAVSTSDVPEGNGESVLIVEDETMILEVAIEILEGLGYKVTSASTPEAALQLVEEEGLLVDALVTDVIMPGMNGRELADRVRAIRPGLGVLFMSGYTAQIMEQRGMVEGRDSFVQKPFSTKDIAVKLRAVLDGRAPQT